ncbi:rubrerythrin family protein [Sporohalobacter salinus]|uniref:rubrerythrin family protein n=1 Tax=Sporohalobacter salinus TaxID=1494606 RepID=UPI00195F8DFE|nr:rubrerythrin family protein [Sporohalobacter salinus]MBM7624742.1 rubrerythrin [Sporohalobacter salinus]
MTNNEITAENLRSAFGGESQAYQRYKIWGSKAKEDGFPKVEVLFNAIAYAEEVHANNHFTAHANIEGDFLVASSAGFGLGSTVENLTGAIAGENFEIEQMYPSYHLVAQNQEETEAAKSFYYALEAEKIHSQLYTEAKKAVEAGNDYELDYISVCENCGHTVKDDTPEECPICGAKKAKFKEFRQ